MKIVPRASPSVQLDAGVRQLQYTCSLGVVQGVLLMYKCGIGHGTPGGTPGNKKVHFSSTARPLGGVLLVAHPMYSRTPSGMILTDQCGYHILILYFIIANL